MSTEPKETPPAEDKSAEAMLEDLKGALTEEIGQIYVTRESAEEKYKGLEKRLTAEIEKIKERLSGSPMPNEKAKEEYKAVEYLRDVVRVGEGHRLSPRLKVMTEASDESGGYTVPVEYNATIIDKSLEAGIVKPRAKVIQMSSNRTTFLGTEDYDHSSNYFGGVVIYRPGESGSKTASEPDFEQIALNLHKMTGLVYVTDELLEDSVISLPGYLSDKFGQAIAFTEDYDYFSGTGANQALGVFNSPCLVTAAKVGGQDADTIVYGNICQMWSQLAPGSHGAAVWVTNHDCFPQIAQMTIDVGTGGGPVWLPGGGAADTPNGSIFGRPLILSEKLQTLGDAGDLLLADFSHYYIGNRAGSGGVQTASSIHIAFDYDRTAFRFVYRYDGKPDWTSALTPKVSTTTLSPFVTLIARA